ncbi:MAG: carbamoyl-phosphate synthase domain-containing protein [Euryarchaeota archaeon]|nr:carbamoyl-phosphate synthase domain-containing protein [Euryarchaeota archaeon]
MPCSECTDGTIVSSGWDRIAQIRLFHTQAGGHNGYTGLTRYEMVLTDPSYRKRILMFAYPSIRTYGVIPDAFRSSGVQAEEAVVWEACDHPPHNQYKESVYEFLEREGKPGITEIATRRFTIKTRRNETLRATLIVDGATELSMGTCRGTCTRAAQHLCNRPDIKGNVHETASHHGIRSRSRCPFGKHHPEAHPGRGY